MKIFLGGTCNNSTWRDELIALLRVDYFNPILEDQKLWNDEYRKIEEEEKEKSDFRLYVITPKMTGCFSIAEAVDDSNKIPSELLFCVLSIDDGLTFNDSQMKSLEAIKDIILKNGARVFDSLQEIAFFLNNT